MVEGDITPSIMLKMMVLVMSAKSGALQGFYLKKIVPRWQASVFFLKTNSTGTGGMPYVGFVRWSRGLIWFILFTE